MKIKAKQLESSRTDFFYYAFRNILLVSIPLLILFALILGFSVSHSSATTNLATDNFTLSIPVSCTLTASIKAGEEHSISMVSGQYKADIGKTTMDTTCNDPNGFVVYAIGSSNNEEGNNRLKALTLSDAYDIASGTAESGNVSNWAMKLTPIANGDFTPTIDNNYTQYSIVPNTWTKVAHKNPGTTDITKKTSFTTTYAVYLESTQPAGTYRGQVKYVMFHPSTAAEPTDTIEHAFALAGKSKVQVTDPITGQSGSFYKMQDMTTNICESTTLVDEQNTLQLVDIRDNKLYWVTKLQDGHCWMTQNLDLDLGVKDTTLGINTTVLTSEDTDLNDNSLMGVYKEGYKYENGVLSWTPANNTINFTGTTVIGWQDSNTAPYSASKTDSAETGYTSLGNYYNWTAAIVSNNSSLSTASTYSNIQNNPQNSICPKGWRLPIISNQSSMIAGSTNEFSRLNYIYNGDSTQNDQKLVEGPLYFTKAGSIRGKTLDYLKSSGFYSSSTLASGSESYYLNFSQTNVAVAGNYNGRLRSSSIRCIAR